MADEDQVTPKEEDSSKVEVPQGRCVCRGEYSGG